MGNRNNYDINKKEFNKLKGEYFQSIQSNLKLSCEQNKTNKMNTAISMHKTEFTAEKCCLQIKIAPNKKYIHWKEYFYLYLNREAGRNNQWAIDLYHAIKDEEFSNELSWLSLFFYQEYTILTKPKCLSSLQQDSIDLSKIDTSRFQFENNYSGSFLSVNEDGLINDNHAFLEYNYYKHFIKEYIAIFKLHIFNNTHPVNIIVQLFVEEISKIISQSIIESRHEVSKKNKEKRLQNVVNQLQKFIVEMQVIVKLFYSKAISYKYFIEEKDEFNNLVTALLFKTGNIYQLMFDLFEITYKEEILELKNKLIQYKDVTPEELGIAKQFRLDHSTKAYQIELIALSQNEGIINRHDNNANENQVNNNEIIDINKKKSCQNKKKNNVSNSINKIRPQTFNDNIANENELDSFNKEIVVVSESQKLSQFVRNRKSKFNVGQNGIDYSQTHFQEAINLLKEIDTLHGPFEKIMAIATISAEITSSVNNAWQNIGNAIPQSLLKIEADQLMNIYLYIIIKAQFPMLYVHLCFARHFTSEKTKSFSSIGYYFTTFGGCIDYIIDMKDKDLEKQADGIIDDGSINN